MQWGTTTEIARDSFALTRTHPNHLRGVREPAGGSNDASVQNGFQDMLFASLNDVNSAQQQHEGLAVQAIVDPDSVNTHDVTVAAAKADLSLRITKAVTDRVISAYRELSGLR